ncbi:MAG: hypothetical protein KGV43_02085 [Arcobacter sp.]|nr:hypothetical protein [Arcobacter sp.]
MKYYSLLLIPFVSFSYAKNFKQEESWKYDGRLSGYFQKIDIENQESQKEGYTHSQDLDLKFHGPLKNGNAGVELRARTTNDERIQKNDSHLLFFKGYFKNKYWSYELGDVAAAMNPYVYSGSLKGIKVEYFGNEKERNWDYTFISGAKKAHWRETYQLVENEGLDTFVGAFQAKYTHERSKEIKFSLVSLKDDLNSGDNSSDLGKEGVSFGLNGKWRFNKYITLKGRTAISKASDDIRNNKKKSTKSAIKLRLLTRPLLSKLRSNFAYERVSPNFISVAGSAKPDKEEFQNITRWKINKELSSKLNLRFKRDNLNGQLEDTLYKYYQTLSFTYRPKKIKGSNFNLKFSNKDEKGRKDNNRYTIDLNTNLRQKNGFRYGLGYGYSHYDNKDNDKSSSITNTLKLTLGYRKSISKESSYRFTIKADGKNIRKNGKSDNRIGVKLDAGYKHNKRLSMDLAYISRHLDKEEGNDTLNSTYQFKTTYKLDDKGKKTVRLLLEKRDYRVDNNSDSNYNEHIGKLSYVYNF